MANRGDSPSEFEYAIYRAKSNGKAQMRLTPWSDDRQRPLEGDDPGTWVFGLGGGVLVYELSGYWAIDLRGVSRVACFQLPATIVGTPGDDVINGTDGPDIIASRGGNDVVRGGLGDDRICLGLGDDFGSGQGGDDRMVGNAGNDVLLGWGGDDKIWDSSGSNTANGGAGIHLCLVAGTTTNCENP